MADCFFATHMAPGYTAFPYPRDIFLKFIAENDGQCCLCSSLNQCVHTSIDLQYRLGLEARGLQASLRGWPEV